ncbi:anaerobic ribonucleoside-triphosphate reductase activating protein [Halorhabdus salina]|uniref:anaerobic ribonucleoside-triphosphate reductase activating protein n=1 Tax=Halorhabdus salina TaxID=2750670 RepID=UPI0015EFB93D|nr:anaerobic ribonucleoside-triphosphate reductase activating protein [Halorhabdus salina]
MNLGGLQRTTLSDFPGRVACTVFTAGCNIQCPYCQNPSLLDERPQIETQDVFELLDTRANLLDGVVISGGEPTLQDDLPAFVERIADRGLDVKLDTNGTRPDTLRETLETGAIDYVAMDLKTLPKRYDELGARDGIAEAIERSVELVRDRAPASEFRTTFDPGVVAPADFERLAALAGDGPLYVQRVETGAVLSPERVEPTPSEPLEAIEATLGDLPSPVTRRSTER